MSKISELHSRKAKLIADATAIVNRGLNTTASRAEHKKLTDELNDIQSDIDMLERIERSLPAQSASVATPAPVENERTSRRHKKHKVNAAWRQYLRHGYVSSPELRDLVTTSDSGGGALIPQEFDSAYTSALKFYGPIASLVKVGTETTGRPRKYIVSDDTSATMTYLAETGGTSGVEADPALSSTVPGTDTLVTTVLYSVEELDDAFDLNSFLRDIAGVRVGRAVEYALTTGTDNGTNTALPNSPTGGFLGGLTAGVTMSSGTLSSGPTYQSLVSLKGSVDFAYQISGSYMVNPATHEFLEAQVDSTGRPLYKHDPNTGLLQVSGKPVYVNNAMPAYSTASKPAVLFGTFDKALVYHNGGGMQIKVLNERYMDRLLKGVVIYHRIGAAQLVSNAVKALVTAAS